MSTNMTVLITIHGEIDSRGLYSRVCDIAHVTDLGNKTFVYSLIDIREDTIEKLINICKEYGEVEVDAHRVKG